MSTFHHPAIHHRAAAVEAKADGGVVSELPPFCLLYDGVTWIEGMLEGSVSSGPVILSARSWFFNEVLSTTYVFSLSGGSFDLVAGLA